MTDGFATGGSIEAVAERLATILAGQSGGLRDPGASDLVFERDLRVLPLERGRSQPPEIWAVDGGQALVADARCLQVYATRAARVRWAQGVAPVEEQLPLRAWLLGLGQDGQARAEIAAEGAALQPDCPVDVNLLRSWGEWDAARACVEAAPPGAVVLVDGDLQTDWRISPEWLAHLLEVAQARSVTLVGVTKHTSLSWGGAPLLGVVERLAAEELGPRARWWVPVGRREPGVGPGIEVVVARLDPDARFSFRVDLPSYAEPAATLGVLARVSDDAAFPGYPYPLSSADRLAACPAWVRHELWHRMDELFERRGIDADTRDRAFADRHHLMERS